MRTDDLVAMLANGAGAAAPMHAGRRMALASTIGALTAAPLLIGWLGLNPELAEAARLPMFWVKLGFAGAVAAGALAVTRRLARPGDRVQRALCSLAVPFALLWILAALVLAAAAPEAREELVFGETWASCPINIALLSVPTFIAAFAAMKALAPTRLVLAGASAGLLAGAVGAWVYTLHCPELAAPFLGLWYIFGMLIPAVIGALLGPRLLRW
ncbi:MAG: NrsF family protein [Burkholderiaceae bacterium]